MALKSELALATYNGSNDAQCANYLNTSTGTALASFVPSYTVLNACVVSELAGLSQLQLSQFQVILSPGVVDTRATNTRTALGNLFPGTGQTRANLLALQVMTVSRADFLNLGFGRPLDYADIARARIS